MNTGRVAGKIALVAGAASGIGRATAELLEREGATVFGADRSFAGASSANAIALEVTEEASWMKAMDQVLAIHGRLDILVNSAGISSGGPVTDLDLTEWRRVLAVNLDGAFLGTKHALRAMRDGGGSIINVSSASGIKASPGASAYSTSKAAVCMFSKVAAKEGAPLQIRVNTVCPASVKTPLWLSMPFFQELIARTGSEDAAFQELAGPGGRFSEPEEIALAILYLASDEARFVTGTDLVIDGGWTA